MKGNKNCLGKHWKILYKRKSISTEDREKRSEFSRGHKNPNAKAVMAEFIKFLSIKEAANAMSVNICTITRRIQKNKPGYFYLE